MPGAPLPMPPEAAAAVAGPRPLKLTAVESPVLPATLALGTPSAGIAVADALPPKASATAAEQPQLSADQPRVVFTKAVTASRIPPSDATVALRVGADGATPEPPLVTWPPGAFEELTELDGALEDGALEAELVTGAELADVAEVAETAEGEEATDVLPAAVGLEEIEESVDIAEDWAELFDPTGLDAAPDSALLAVG